MGAAIAKLVGSVGSNLTNTGVQQVPAAPTIYTNPVAAGQLVAADSAAATMPGRSDMSGTITPPTLTSTQVGDTPPAGIGPMQDPAVSVTENPDATSTPRFTAAPVGQQPIVSHPSFDPIMHPEQLSTKGKILDLVLQTGMGVANGLAAGSEALARSGGRVNPGIGPSMAAGFATPGNLRQQAVERQAQETSLGQDAQLRQAQITNIPLQRQMIGADLANKMSSTQKNLSDAGAAQSKSQLDLAESLAKPYIKGEDGMMYRAGQDGQGNPSLTPVQGVGVTLPVDKDLAHSIGRDDLADKYLPAATVARLKAIADAGQTITSANGRQLIINKSTGATVKDLGTATPIMTANIKTAGQPDARLDKSYQYNQGRLDKIRTPVDTLAARFGRLQDTINQNSPQADALVAPELLTVMAGGQGSGLRMNEAEIARIVGGRSKWLDLQAAANKWRLDPKAANSITPDQRTQIRALVGVVGQKINTKQSILSDGENQLLDAPDVATHRRILADTQNKLDAIDGGAAGNTGNNGPAKSSAGGFFADTPGAVIRGTN